MEEEQPAGYEFPQALSGPDAAWREYQKLRRGMRRAAARGDTRTVSYLDGRMERLRSAARDMGVRW